MQNLATIKFTSNNLVVKHELFNILMKNFYDINFFSNLKNLIIIDINFVEK